MMKSVEELKRQRAELDRQIKELQQQAIERGSVKIRQEHWKMIDEEDWILSIMYMDDVVDDNNRYRSVARVRKREDAIGHIDRIIKDLQELREALINEQNEKES
jgi:hypothetical protein